MYFKYGEPAERALILSERTDISALPHAVHEVFHRFMAKNAASDEIDRIEIRTPVSEEAIAALAEKGISYEAHEDGFLLLTRENTVTVYADGEHGTLNGLMTLLRLLDERSRYAYRLVWDHPFSSFRGVKIMMPAREEIDDYKRFIDLMMYFRHNTVMIEVGGAMEYKRHPEINEGWEEYCAFMSEYSGKSKILQEHTYPWRKNSIHSNNGGGSYLTQEEVRGLIAYANERGITVIPEVPCTSHCDYLLTRHPELAERPEDPYPDTFCPSNPDSYKLLFDVFDEVIEVFRPEVMNVGHDEYYSINICDRCRKRIMDVADIFAEDLTKIHDYLASKGVKTMFWCDKIMDIRTENGANEGGALNFVYFRWDPNDKLLGIVPPTWRAREKLPKDIICMNWMWGRGERYDSELDGFPVVFGNFRGAAMRDYRRRCGDRVSGAMCSNWGATKPVYLQRNGIYFEVAYNDRLFWDSAYDDGDVSQFIRACDDCFTALFTYRYGPQTARGEGRYISVTHSTEVEETYHDFVDGVYAEGEEYEREYTLGSYHILYVDGDEARLPVRLGEQVGAGALLPYGQTIRVKAGDDTPGRDTVKIDPRIKEIAYAAIPEWTGDGFCYHTLLEDPNPGKKIEKVIFVPTAKGEGKFKVHDIAF